METVGGVLSSSGWKDL